MLSLRQDPRHLRVLCQPASQGRRRRLLEMHSGDPECQARSPEARRGQQRCKVHCRKFRPILTFTRALLTVCLQHTSTANNSATGSFYNKTGGVSLTTSRSTAMTTGSGNTTAVSIGISTRTSAGTYNGARSSAAGSSHFSTTTNNSEAPPTYALRQTGWVHIPNVRHANLPYFST
jgi:hypothetical protein